MLTTVNVFKVNYSTRSTARTTMLLSTQNSNPDVLPLARLEKKTPAGKRPTLHIFFIPPKPVRLCTARNPAFAHQL
jgi:hypothetical protein